MRFELEGGTVIEGTVKEIAKFYEIAGGGSDGDLTSRILVDGKEVSRSIREEETDKDVVKPTINFKDSNKDESKDVEVGDKIRITDAYMAAGEYENGDIITVKHLDEDGDVRLGSKEGSYISANEFEVIDSDSTKFSEGDYVVMKDDGVFDDILAGDVVIHAGLNTSSGLIKVELLDGSDYDFITEDELEKFYHHADDAAFIRAGRRVGEFKDGDIAEVITSPSASPLGTIVVVTRAMSNHIYASDSFTVDGSCVESKNYVYARYNLKLVTPVENRVDIHAE